MNHFKEVKAMARVLAPSAQAEYKKYIVNIKNYDGKIVKKLPLAKVINRLEVNIPRHFAEGKILLADLNWENINVKDNIKLKREQKEIIRDFIEFYKPFETFGGIITAKTGSGKTVMAIKIISMLKLKTLIVVPTRLLIEQWKEKVAQFTDIDKEDMGLIQGEVCDVNHPITIGVLKSLAMKEYDPKVYDMFGLTIFDEGHLLGAETFSKVAYKFNDKFRLMLSATARRKDGAEKVFEWNIGKIINKSETKIIPPKVFVVKSATTDEKGCYYDTWESSKFSSAKFLNKLNDDKRRTRLIAKAVNVMLDNNRNILVLSDRKDLLKSISLLLEDKDVGWAIFKKRDTDHQIILGTYQVAGLGLDVPKLDTLIFATPRTDIEQAVGRIVREVKGKKRPYVIDIVDVKSPIITKYYYVRRNFYNKVNAKIKGGI